MSGQSPHDLGLRDDDLTAAEREARDVRLAEDAEARDEHAFGLDLFDRLAALSEPEVRVTASAVRDRVRKRPTRWWTVAVPVALAAAALFVVRLPGDPEVRNRGGGTGAGGVSLEAVAKRPDGALRPLGSGGVVAPEEQVLFRIETQGAGALTLREDGVAIHPVVGDWRVNAGRHSPGGDEVLGFRTDAGPGLHRYTVILCPNDTPTDCVHSALELEWAE